MKLLSEDFKTHGVRGNNIREILKFYFPASTCLPAGRVSLAMTSISQEE
jgi:hypothetical protein